MSLESGAYRSEGAEGGDKALAEPEDRAHALENGLRLKHGQAEDALQLMRYILDQARDEASLAGPDGRFYYVNDAKCRSLGYTREEMLSMHVWDVDSGLTEEKWASVWREIRDHGFKMFETWHRTKHGRLFRTEVTATYFDFHGREYLCAFVRDITERKRGEEALWVSEERLRRACRAGQIGLYEWNVDRDRMYFSPEASELYGLGPGSPTTYEEWLPCVHPGDRGMAESRFAENQEKARREPGFTSRIEYRVLHGDGAVLWLEVQSTYDMEGGDLIVRGAVRDITKRKRAEEALRESEERLRRASRAGGVGLFEWNVDGGTAYFSPEAYELYGLEPGSPITYGTWLTIVHPDDREAVDRAIAEEREKAYNKSGASTRIEFRALRPDGSVFWLLATATCTIEGGDLIARGAVRDITERKRADEARRASERNLARAQAISHIGNWQLDPVTKVGSGSDEFFRVLGILGREKLFYSEFIELVHPDDRPLAQAVFEEVKRTHQQKSFDFRIVRPDGEERYVFLDGEITADAEGRPSMFGTMQDITERKRAEKELWMNKEKFRVLADTSHGLIAVHNGSNLLYVNEQAVSLTGYTKDELLGMPFWKLFTDDGRETIKKRAFGRLAGESVPASDEATILTRDGKIKWVNMTAGLFFYEDKPAIISTMFDITDRKNAEKELKEAKAQAELYVDLMGHDINNFNQTARGYLELMDGMVEDEKLKELISKPLEAVDSSSRLIRNVQKLQRARSGESQVDVLDLGALVGEVAGHFRSLSGDMSVNIACDTVKGVRVRANELLRDVFVNLVGNAIKHSAVPAYIDIRMASNEGNIGYCKVIIDDNGPGVPDDMKEKIFVRLSRGNTKARGSGLGLYLVRSLVESYGGRVWVEDKVKGNHTKGARFVVKLPIVRGGGSENA